MDFLPYVFGSRFLAAETQIYVTMDEFCSDYTGGFWNFYNLSNGGCYMAFDYEGDLLIENVNTYYKGTMSSDAAGIMVTLIVLSDMSCIADELQQEHIAKMYHLLMAYAYQHPEYSAIIAACD